MTNRYIPHRGDDVCETCGLERVPTAAEIRCAVQHKFGTDNPQQVVREIRLLAEVLNDLARGIV